MSIVVLFQVPDVVATRFAATRQRILGSGYDYLRDTRANVAMMFAIASVPLLVATGAVVDFTNAFEQSTKVQDAMDSAALAADKKMGLVNETQVKAEAQTFFDANIGNKLTIVPTLNTALAPPIVTLTTQLHVPTYFLGMIGINEFVYNLHSVATAGGSNLEVSLILDTTNSMSGQKIADLKTAAAQLVNIVVHDVQVPFYSKVALDTYSMAVNTGSYAQLLRGAIAGPKTITNATRANPVVITAPAHGFTNGQVIYITGVSGMTQINNKAFTVANKTTNTFALSGVNGSSYGSFAGTASAYCTSSGCQYYSFTNAASPSSQNVFQVSTCVTERNGANAYTDAPPTTTLLGRNYAAPSNPCPSGNEIVPLTDDKIMLTNRINALQALGSTGGHIGVAWGWYLLSPKFSYL